MATSEAIENLTTEGYAVLRSVLDPEALDLVRDECERLLCGPTTWGRDRLASSDGFREVLMLAPSLAAQLLQTDVVGVATGYLGTNIHVTGSHLLASDPLSQTRTIPSKEKWHYDTYAALADLAPSRPKLSVKASFHLSDCSDPRSGPTWVVPRSQHISEFDNLDHSKAIPVLADPGDVLVFDTRLWHAQGPNVAGHQRRILMLQVGFRWLAPSYADFELPHETDVAPWQRQLLRQSFWRSEDGSVQGTGPLPLSTYVDEHCEG